MSFLILAKAYVHLGNALLGMNKFDEAKQCWISALQIDSENAKARDCLLKCMRMEGKDPEKARKLALQDPEVEEVY